jgi:hypothetical protein
MSAQRRTRRVSASHVERSRLPAIQKARKPCWRRSASSPGLVRIRLSRDHSEASSRNRWNPHRIDSAERDLWNEWVTRVDDIPPRHCEHLAEAQRAFVNEQAELGGIGRHRSL